MMHTGNLATLQNVIGHYGTINLAPGNTNLDPRLRPNGFGQKLNLTVPEVNTLIAFKKIIRNKFICRFKMVKSILIQKKLHKFVELLIIYKERCSKKQHSILVIFRFHLRNFVKFDLR